jgi:5'(3')-deoxyribonucleotidase
VDGVLRDYIGGVCRHINKIFRRNITPDAFLTYDMSQTLSPEEMKQVGSWSKQGGFFDLKWYRGAKEFLFWLRGKSEIHILTAALEQKDATKKFLFPYVEEENIHFVSPSWKAQFKGACLIEDHRETLHHWAEQNPKGHGILIHRPWNAGGPQHPRVSRATCFKHAKHLIETRVAYENGRL